jgi:hypothetical protein
MNPIETFNLAGKALLHREEQVAELCPDADGFNDAHGLDEVDDV